MLLGIDSGQTALKAIVIAPDSRLLGSSSLGTERLSSAPHWVERDMGRAWQQCVQVIRDACASARIDPAQVTALSIVGHGDGMYPVDSEGTPTRNAILAMDSRAAGVLSSWQASGLVDAARALTGQEPHAGSIAPLACWLREHEPAVFEATRFFLNCKDWLRLQLTGQVATDIVEASASFGRLDGSGYDPRAFAIYGLPELQQCLPAVLGPMQLAGTVTPMAAELTGLRAGTPVITGTHDIVGAAVGVGATQPGQYSLMAGTYSISQVIAQGRRVDSRWQTRPWVGDDQWVYMAASPASATNLDWFIDTFLSGESDPIGAANAEATAVLDDTSSVQFHPFLFGSPYGAQASAAFLGIHAWHNRGHMFRALFEGVVFNHLVQLNALVSVVTPVSFRLTGGGAKSDLWCQMFADGLDTPVETTDNKEAGALGAALCAGVGGGVFSSLSEGQAACVRVKNRYEPTAAGTRRMAEGFHRYQTSVAQLQSLWPALETVSPTPAR